MVSEFLQSYIGGWGLKLGLTCGIFPKKGALG